MQNGDCEDHFRSVRQAINLIYTLHCQTDRSDVWRLINISANTALLSQNRSDSPQEAARSSSPKGIADT